MNHEVPFDSIESAHNYFRKTGRKANGDAKEASATKGKAAAVTRVYSDSECPTLTRNFLEEA
jgi:hypothetical protein